MERADVVATKLAVAFPLGLITAALGGWDVLAQALIACIVLDVVAGLIRAFSESRLNSTVMRKGLWRKAGYFVAVLLSVMLDRAIFHEAPAARTLVISYLIVNESLSILEHLSLMGVPLPQELRDALLKLRDKKELRDDA